MKLLNVLLGVATLIISLNSIAQDDPNRECDRMRFLGSEAIKVENYKEAAMYYLQGETICGNFDQKLYTILIGCLRNVAFTETDKEAKKAYSDTLKGVYERAEEKGFYDPADDCTRAYIILNSSAPDARKADELFKRCVDAQGVKTDESYMTYYYYNLLSMWRTAKEEQKSEMKRRLIEEYFRLSTLVSEGNLSARTQETLSQYFNLVVKDCNDILPDLKKFMGSLSQDPEVKKSTVKNFIKILDDKNCTESDEYIMLIDTLIKLEPESIETKMMKAKAQMAKKDFKGAISTLQDVKSNATDEGLKQNANYLIALCYYKSHSYSSSYQAAMTVSGEYKGEALIIAGLSVGANINNCGDSDFQRKANYIYAVQLLQQGKSLGASDNGAISNFTAKFPTAEECFNAGNPTSLTLQCYGVTVNPCPQ